MLTAEFGDDVREQAMSARASHFLSKPAKMEELTVLLYGCMQRQPCVDRVDAPASALSLEEPVQTI